MHGFLRCRKAAALGAGERSLPVGSLSEGAARCRDPGLALVHSFRKYGLVHPDKKIAPYDKTLNTMGADERRAWAAKVLKALTPCLAGVKSVVFFAGTKYREFLVPELRRRGIVVHVPMEGLRIGEQLAWLTRII